jgi:aminoglycoside 6'-N-acetyltransferase
VNSYSFRPLARSDFPLLCGWLTQPHVLRWWADDASPEGVEADYGASIDGSEPCDVFIAHRDGTAIGLVQRLRLAAYPEYLRDIEAIVPVPAGTWSIDYLVGDPADTRRGWGSGMVAAFTRRLWEDDAVAAAVIVPVHAENVASWRALERAGYARIATGLLEPDNPADHRKHYLYRIDRP